MEQILTPSEVAKMLRIKAPTVYSWVKKGILPCIKIQKIVRFQRQDIDEFIKKSRINS